MVQSDSTIRLPGMELLGFFDEPYRVRVDRPKPPPRAVARAAMTHIPSPSPPSPTIRPSGRSLVESLWESTTFDDSLLDWRPGVVARRKLGGREMSTATMVATLITTAVLAALLWFGVQRPGHQAEAADVAMRSGAVLVLESIEDLRALTAALGSDRLDDLSTSTSVVLAAESSARELFASAGAVDDSLQPGSRREVAVAASGDVLAASGEINRLLAYRAAAERALLSPALPSDPGAVDLTNAIGAVAAWRADVEEAIAALPAQVLGGHFQLVLDWESGLQAWQERYLDALREGDAAAAEQALARLAADVSALRRDLVELLESEAARIDTELAAAGSQVADLLAG